MTLKKPLALLVPVMVAAFGALASAQAVKKPVAKKPRVFFVEPKNNATVTSPLHMKFGSEGIEIAAVPAGDVKTTRPGVALSSANITSGLPGSTPARISREAGAVGQRYWSHAATSSFAVLHGSPPTA